jgi:hypothetical protein
VALRAEPKGLPCPALPRPAPPRPAPGTKVDVQRVPALLVAAKRLVTRDEVALFRIAVGLLLDRGIGNLAGGWNVTRQAAKAQAGPGEQAASAPSLAPMTFRAFLGMQLSASAVQRQVPGAVQAQQQEGGGRADEAPRAATTDGSAAAAGQGEQAGAGLQLASVPA